MFCKFCGKEISDDANFCPSCGKTLNDGVSIPNERNNNISNTQIQQSKSNSQGMATASLILGIASIILFFAFYFSIPCALLAKYLGNNVVHQKLGGKENAKLGIKLGNLSLKISLVIAVIYLIIIVALLVSHRHTYF